MTPTSRVLGLQVCTITLSVCWEPNQRVWHSRQTILWLGHIPSQTFHLSYRGEDFSPGTEHYAWKLGKHMAGLREEVESPESFHLGGFKIMRSPNYAPHLTMGQERSTSDFPKSGKTLVKVSGICLALLFLKVCIV